MDRLLTNTNVELPMNLWRSLMEYDDQIYAKPKTMPLTNQDGKILLDRFSHLSSAGRK